MRANKSLKRANQWVLQFSVMTKGCCDPVLIPLRIFTVGSAKAPYEQLLEINQAENESDRL